MLDLEEIQRKYDKFPNSAGTEPLAVKLRQKPVYNLFSMLVTWINHVFAPRSWTTATSKEPSVLEQRYFFLFFVGGEGKIPLLAGYIKS